MTITYRGIKEEALTYAELDENFRDLREDTDLERVLINGNVANLTITVPQIIANIALIADSDVTEALAAGNTWTNTSIDLLNGLLQTIINTNALSANSYTVEVGTAGNNYLLTIGSEVGTGANAFASATVANSGTAGNAYTVEVGTAGNNYMLTTGISIGAGANDFANLIGIGIGAGANAFASSIGSGAGAGSNAYTIEVGTAGNNYMLTTGISIGVGANAFATVIGAASNNWSNTKLSNTSTVVGGGLTMTDIHLTSNVTITLSTNVGNVGQVAWDGDYLYVCVATNQWKRTPLTTW